MPRTTEASLYPPVRAFLAAQGYTVRGEVQGCDVVGVSGDAVVVVEMKRAFNVKLLTQGVRRQGLTHSVYLAVPRPASRGGSDDLRGACVVLRRLGLGLLVVDERDGSVAVWQQPEVVRARVQPRRRRALLAEVAGRGGDDNTGGTRGRKLLTAYREDALFLAVALERFGPRAPKILRTLGGPARSRAILAANVYGWFERVERGVYGLSAQGVRDLAHWAAAADRKRALLPAEAPQR